MTVNRRSKVEIYIQVLDLFHQERMEHGEAHLTTVAHRANLPYDRFQKIISKLIERKLVIRTNSGVLLTADGFSCLHKMQQANNFLREMGLNI